MKDDPDWRRLAALAVTLVATALAACGNAAKREEEDRAATAKQMFENYCKSAGVKIYRRVEGVEGILLLKLRPTRQDYDSQFVFDDPYGADFEGLAYIGSMLRGHFQAHTSGGSIGGPPHIGFRFVEAVDPLDGKRYRYTGRLEEPWLTDKSYLKGYMRFVVDKAPATPPLPRYAVAFEDISTRQDREFWIAGSSLKVLDMSSGNLLAERIGYMYDPRQGSRSGFRSPWLAAANYACPSFLERFPNAKPTGSAAGLQPRQTLDFVETVLIPKP